MKNTVLWWTFTLLFASAIMLVGHSSALAQAEDENVSDQNLDDAFWADQRQVRVLQRRLFEKDGRLAFSISGGLILNDPFMQYYPVGARLSFYVQENFGIELSGNYIGEDLRHDTGVSDLLDERYGAEVDVLDQHLWRANLVGLWTPIYGKFTFLRHNIVQFDWNLGAGVGIVNTQAISVDRLTTESVMKPEVLLGTGWTFWLSDHFIARLDFRYMIFEKSKTAGGGGGGTSMPTDISIGLGYFF